MIMCGNMFLWEWDCHKQLGEAGDNRSGEVRFKVKCSYKRQRLLHNSATLSELGFDNFQLFPMHHRIFHRITKSTIFPSTERTLDLVLISPGYWNREQLHVELRLYIVLHGT